MPSIAMINVYFARGKFFYYCNVSALLAISTYYAPVRAGKFG